MNSICTIGHSNLALSRFLELLQEHEITSILDVRSYPRSRYVPHFDRLVLQTSLERQRIGYVFMGKLLGGRSPHPEHYPDGKLDYTLLIESSDFRAGLAQAAKMALEGKVALMCSEEDPLRCHRGLVIARHFHEHGWQVLHIRGSGVIDDQQELEGRLQGDEGATQLDLWQAAPNIGELYRAQGVKIAPEYRRDQPVNSHEKGDL